MVDGDERPLGGALVAIDTQPVSTARREGDGAFSFDGLLGRTYQVEAIHESGAAGPVRVRVAATVEPLILRVGPAASLQVSVVDGEAGRALAGAPITVAGLATRTAVTGPDGRATIGGLGPGW